MFVYAFHQIIAPVPVFVGFHDSGFRGGIASFTEMLLKPRKDQLSVQAVVLFPEPSEFGRLEDEMDVRQIHERVGVEDEGGRFPGLFIVHFLPDIDKFPQIDNPDFNISLRKIVSIPPPYVADRGQA
jgi:hypothetical protein